MNYKAAIKTKEKRKRRSIKEFSESVISIDRAKTLLEKALWDPDTIKNKNKLKSAIKCLSSQKKDKTGEAFCDDGCKYDSEIDKDDKRELKGCLESGNHESEEEGDIDSIDNDRLIDEDDSEDNEERTGSEEDEPIDESEIDENDEEDDDEESEEEEDDSNESEEDDEDDESESSEENSEEDEVEELEKKADIKVFILGKSEMRGFAIILDDEGLSKIIKKLKVDYGPNLRLFFRDDEGDSVNILSGHDLLYAYRITKSAKKDSKNLNGTAIKIKLFADVQENRENIRIQETFAARDPLCSPLVPAAPISYETDNIAAPKIDPSDFRYKLNPEAESVERPFTVSAKEEYSVSRRGAFEMMWRKGEILGEGSFGKVYSCINLTSGEKMAVKEVFFGKYNKKVIREQVRALQREVSILGELSHPNIVKYVGAEFSEDTLRIFLELAPDGSLKDAVNEFGAFPEPLMRSYTSDILKGLDYLHERKLMHRDIKPANLLISNGIVKLADFGCSATLLGSQGRSESNHSTVAGTTIYMAPEVMEAAEDDDAIAGQNGGGGNDGNELKESSSKRKSREKYGRKADIWSLGMTLCELANGQPPFKSAAAAVYAACISRKTPSFPGYFSDEAHSFLARCLVHFPAERADCTELLEHSFLAYKTQEEALAQTANMPLSKGTHMNSTVKLLLPEDIEINSAQEKESPSRSDDLFDGSKDYRYSTCREDSLFSSYMFAADDPLKATSASALGGGDAS